MGICILNCDAEMERVISVFESKTLQLHTTRSWDFLGLPIPSLYTTPTTTPFSLQLAYGNDVVVGIFDSGNPYITYLPYIF